MQYCILNRSDLASLLADVKEGQPRLPGAVSHGEPERPPTNAELCIFWDDHFTQKDMLPVLIVTADEDLDQFLAWAVTFLPTFRPLTSFIRVVPWTLFTLVQGRSSIENVQSGAVLIGTIFGEALTNATNRGFMDSLALTAFESTYSWVMSRTLAVGLNPKILRYVSDAWNTMREFSGPSNRKIPVESLERVWSVVQRITNRTREALQEVKRDSSLSHIEDCCLEIQRSGEMSSFNWDRLSHGRISASAIADSMSSTKERRVETFESVVKNVLRAPSDELSTSFLVGYLASLISGGSLEHAQILIPLQAELPTAMLWYGVCAGLLPSSRVLTDNSHLGLRTLRLLNRNETLMSPPTCDISLSELEVLLRGELRSRGFRQSHSSFVRVELVPMVSAVIRSLGRAAVNNEQLGLFGTEDRPVVLEADRLRDLVTTLRGSLLIAESLLGSKAVPSSSAGSQYRGKRRR